MLEHESIQESLVHGESPACLSMEDLRGCVQKSVMRRRVFCLSPLRAVTANDFSPTKLTRPRHRVHSEIPKSFSKLTSDTEDYPSNIKKDTMERRLLSRLAVFAYV